VRVPAATRPEPQARRGYGARFAEYDRLYAALKANFARLAAIEKRR
jgi:hypothetical protein